VVATEASKVADNTISVVTLGDFSVDEEALMAR
jgi:hypothetical protein